MSDKDRIKSKDLEGSQDHKATSSRKESSKKSKNAVSVESSGGGGGGGGENGKNEGPLQGLSPETQRLIESIRNQNSSNSNSKSKKNVPHSMVEDILREAKLKAASRAIDSNHHVKKSSREESRKNNDSNSNNKIHESGESKKHAKLSSTTVSSS